MILTLTPNPGIDYTLQVADFRLNATLRARSFAWGMAGKPTDAAWILGRLGAPVQAFGFAAGINGQRMESMLRARGVKTDFIQVEGESRLNVVVVDGEKGQSTVTTDSLIIQPKHLTELMDRYENALPQAECVILGGSLPADVPPEFHAEAILLARRKEIPVIFDASGELLRAGLSAHPTVVKPNRQELADLLGRDLGPHSEVERLARDVREQYGCQVIVTLGAEGAFAILENGCFFIPPLGVPVVSAAGSGDGVLAGLALAYLRRQPPEQGLRYGFALAGAILQTLGTADFDVEDYQHLLPLVELHPLPEFSDGRVF